MTGADHFMGYAWSQQDESVGAGFLRIATEQVAKAILNADAIGEPPAGRIHSARRHCKRLRGLFRLVRGDFPAYKSANIAVRDAADQLSAVRDAAVLRETLAKLYEWAGQPLDGSIKVDPVDPAIEEAALQAFRSAMSDLLGQSKGWKIEKIDRRTLAQGFGRYYGLAADAAHDARRKPSDEAFHDWRKQVKYHSFQLILLKHCLADAEGLSLERVEQLAEVLGKHHDLAVLCQTVHDTPEKLGVEVDAAFVALNAGLLQERLAGQAFRLADEIFARPPKTVRDSIDNRWRAWWQPAMATEPA